jgi:hypothetical protein
VEKTAFPPATNRQLHHPTNGAPIFGACALLPSALEACLSLPLSAAITLLPAPLDRFSLLTVWSIPILAIGIWAAAYLAARSLCAFWLICAAALALFYVSMFYGKYIADTTWHGTDVYKVAASADAPTVRQMYYDIITRELWPPPSPSDFIYVALKDQLRQQIEAKRSD